MRHILSRSAALALVVLAVAGTSCSIHVPGSTPPPGHAKVKKTGPPPWAPAHGYRHHHRGTELVYDNRLEVYLVAGKLDVYFRGSRFYKKRGKHWVSSANAHGPWMKASKGQVPPGLR